MRGEFSNLQTKKPTNTMETEIKNIKINEVSLRKALVTAVIQAEGFDLSGFRIPLFVDAETGEITAGSWISQNSWQPDAIEVPFVNTARWSLSEVSNEDNYDGEWGRDEEVNYYAEESADYQIQEMRERFKSERWGNYEFELV